MQGQQDIYGGEEGPLSPAQVPDPALSRRLARRDLNRSMAKAGSTRVGAVRGTPNEPFATHRISQSTSEYGVPAGDLLGGGQRSHFKPFANAEFRRLGTYKEIPNDDFISQQGSVDRRRVAELTTNPELGRSPRIPDEKPLVVHGMAREYPSGSSHLGDPQPAPREANVIVNGNHRIMSGIARGEMFSPAISVDATADNEDAAGQIRASIEQELPYSAHATRMLKYDSSGVMPDDVVDRTKAFVAEKRRNYWDAGSS